MTTIHKLIEDGEVTEAKEALENLLHLGPNNIDALKLKAALAAQEGRFKDEEKIWCRILEICQDDEDAIDYIQQRQIDFYFTDDLPGGGRRFLAYPRTLVKISFVGLLGCISFLLLTKFAAQKGWTLSAQIIFSAFFVMVILPWIAIIYTWIRSLKNITVSLDGIEVAMRFKRHVYKWEDIKIYLVCSQTPTEPNLRLVIHDPCESARSICLDLNEGSSAIRARSFLVSEITSHFSELGFATDHDLNIKELRPVFC